MLKRGRPGVDAAIAPRAGRTRDGQPLSFNRAPAPDLAPWIGRVYATIVDVPPDYVLSCGLLNDSGSMRIQLAGEWEADTADGILRHNRAALVFGPQTRRMPITVKGSFISVGCAFRPGCMFALGFGAISGLVDRIVPLDELGVSSATYLEPLSACATGEEMAKAFEDVFRSLVDVSAAQPIDPVTARFEALAFSDPSANVADFAREVRIDRRKLERLVRRDFGMSPKQVLRRARALDMASHLRGVADTAEADALALRYYDQSHLIHEFTELFGMSPGQFVERPQPILTLALESRQARRLEAIERLVPGQTRPWE